MTVSPTASGAEEADHPHAPADVKECLWQRSCVEGRNAALGSVLTTEAVETHGKGSALAPNAVQTHGKYIVLAPKAGYRSGAEVRRSDKAPQRQP